MISKQHTHIQNIEGIKGRHLFLQNLRSPPAPAAHLAVVVALHLLKMMFLGGMAAMASFDFKDRPWALGFAIMSYLKF